MHIFQRRHDMIACLGEVSGQKALSNIYDKMRNCSEGNAVLKDRPRINSKTVDLKALKNLPANTFGRIYYKFLEDNKVTPDSRLTVQFLDDVELGYVMQRYRECHDLYHAVLGMPTHMLGEVGLFILIKIYLLLLILIATKYFIYNILQVTVKWIEALNNELPMCIGGALFGALRLRPKQRMMYKNYYLPWAIKVGQAMPPLMCIYWEKRWDQPIDDLRRELNIEMLKLPK